MKRISLLALLLVLILGAALTASAQDGTGTPAGGTSQADLDATATPAPAQTAVPTESPLDNACYTGGSMEGKCDWPTQDEEDWAWNCGWYVARYDQGLFTPNQVPEWCNFFFLDEGAPTTCFEFEGYFEFVGPFNTLNNTADYGGDETCTSPDAQLYTTVTAADETAADDACAALSKSFGGVVHLPASAVGRDDLWVCQSLATI
jgi:hypothetical protein